MFLITTKFNHN